MVIGRSVSSGHPDSHLGTGAWRASDRGLAAMALDPINDRAPYPLPVRRHRVEVEAASAVADVGHDRARLHLGVGRQGVDARVTSGVDHRLPDRAHERLHPLVQIDVAHHHQVHRDGVGVLDLGGHGPQGVAHMPSEIPRGGGLGPDAGVQERAQLPLLAAGETGDLAGESALRWMSASVWSTESCRWAARLARSCDRTRSRRSSLRSVTIRTHQGPVISATPTRVIATACRPSRTAERFADANTAAQPTTTSPVPATTRACPHRSSLAAVSEVRDIWRQRSRWPAPACRHSKAAPTQPMAAGMKRSPKGDSHVELARAMIPAAMATTYWSGDTRLLPSSWVATGRTIQNTA